MNNLRNMLRLVTIRCLFFLSMVCSLPLQILAQGLVQAGGQIVFTDGGHLVVDGMSGNYYDTLLGKIYIVNSGYMYVPGNWTNVSGGEVFTSNLGEVSLTGGIQNIGGNQRTSFPSLFLLGTGDKTLKVHTLVGGGFGGGGNGILHCNNHLLFLNSNLLETNNPSIDALKASVGGGIVSETDASTGYGTVQWNVRNNLGLREIPFATATGKGIPYLFDIQTAGVNSTDSGSISVSTYGTNATSLPNNLPWPTNVNNTQNEFGRQNAQSMVDRFWVVNENNFSLNPISKPTYSFLDTEVLTIGGSTNDIIASDLRPTKYNTGSNSWIYTQNGNSDVANKSVDGVYGSIGGIWTISDSTPCPNANFVWDGHCELSQIYFEDKTILSKGSLEQWNWNFDDSGTANIEDPSHVFQLGGTYNVQLIITATSGCSDTILIATIIDEKAIADFSFEDNPSYSIPLQFNNNSQKSDDWYWDFGDFNQSRDEHPSHVYASEGLYDVQLIADNSAHCPDTIVKQVDVGQPGLLLIPSAFSPGNRDALNATFGLNTLQKIHAYKLTVYSRWGEKIFESNDLNQRWDGTYLGQPVMEGNYLFMLSYRDSRETHHYQNGIVTLLRH